MSNSPRRFTISRLSGFPTCAGRLPLVDSTKRPLWLVAGLLALLVGGGCGGGRQANPILADYQRAMAIENPEARAKQLVQIARRQADAGDRSGAEKTLSSATSAAEQVADAKGRAESLNAIAAAYGKLDRAFEIKKLIGKIERAAGEVADLEAGVSILARMAVTQGLYLDDQRTAASTLSDAETRAGSIERPAGRVDSLMTVALAWYGLGDEAEWQRLVDEALNAARNIEDMREQANSLMSISGMLSRMKHPELAKETLAEAQRVTASIQDPLSRAYALADLGREFKAVGEPQTAEQMFDQAHSLLDVVDGSMRSSLLEKIASARRGI